ncbi:hypothetical protein [Litchfieldia alkalitelluris]|uniref:hypothetical protein n=1 Tax=Litchfieldia alkalitelluris TaxID=304268 RepID=UPI00099781F5|nr:hypothetical protein [Litchfieldia alkalitelluris]
MDNDEKISKWIKQMESEGKTRDEIARGVFVSKSPNGTFTTYKLSKSGKTKYNLNIHIGALNLDEM